MRAEGSEEPPLDRVGIRWGKNIPGKGNKAGCRVGAGCGLEVSEV